MDFMYPCDMLGIWYVVWIMFVISTGYIKSVLMFLIVEWYQNWTITLISNFRWSPNERIITKRVICVFSVWGSLWGGTQAEKAINLVFDAFKFQMIMESKERLLTWNFLKSKNELWPFFDSILTCFGDSESREGLGAK